MTTYPIDRNALVDLVKGLGNIQKTSAVKLTEAQERTLAALLVLAAERLGERVAGGRLRPVALVVDEVDGKLPSFDRIFDPAPAAPDDAAEDTLTVNLKGIGR